MKQFMWFRATYISLRPYLGNLQHVHTMPGQLRIARAGQDASLFPLAQWIDAISGIGRHQHHAMSSDIARKSLLMTLPGTMSTAQRIAPVLPNLSGGHKARGYTPAEFNLRITCETIATYLGMKLENSWPDVFKVSEGQPHRLCHVEVFATQYCRGRAFH